MHLHGQPRMENTRPITSTNHLWGRSPASKHMVAPPTLRGGVALPLHLPTVRVDLAVGNTWPCIGYKVGAWSMTIARTIRETILKHQSVGVDTFFFLFFCQRSWYLSMQFTRTNPKILYYVLCFPSVWSVVNISLLIFRNMAYYHIYDYLQRCLYSLFIFSSISIV